MRFHTTSLISTHTVGTVVSPGTVLMSLVPHDEPLQAEVLVRNEDVGFVHEGQRFKVKLEAYPFQKYGMLDGTVVYVGPDAAEQGASGATESNSLQVEAAPGLRYKALVKLEAQYLETDDKRMRLSAGMQVVA